MNFKLYFLDWRKFFLFAVISLIILVNVFVLRGYIYPDIGYPLPIYDVIRLGGPGQPLMLSEEFDYPNIVINIIIWYLASFFIVWIFDKTRNKKP